jgi:ABC-type uncharacterized transport system substrate-binding protein
VEAVLADHFEQLVVIPVVDVNAHDDGALRFELLHDRDNFFRRFDHQAFRAESLCIFIELAAKTRMPTMYGQREYVDDGGLMAYGPNYRAVFRRAAIYVDKILKGTKPADLPVEQPTKFELVISRPQRRLV